MTLDISERVLSVIEAELPERLRAKTLERRTGLPSTTWSNFLNHKQKATAAMIEAVSRQWPQYAFWMATGITDSQYGHVGTAVAYTNSANRKRLERDLAPVYFKIKIAQMDGREADIENDLLDLKFQVEWKQLYAEGEEPWEDEAIRRHYRNADPAEKLRMEIEYLRDMEVEKRRGIDWQLGYPIKK